MKTSLIILATTILTISVFNVNAHIIGGQITAEAVSGQNFTYQIKFILYTDIGSEVAFAGSEIHLGVGESVYIDYEEVESATSELRTVCASPAERIAPAFPHFYQKINTYHHVKTL